MTTSPLRTSHGAFFPRFIALGLAAAAFVAVPRFARSAELAKVDGRSVTDADVMTALGGLSEGQRKTLLKDPTSRRQVLTNVIDQELLVREAEKEKLDQERDYKQALEGFRKQYLSNKILMKALGSRLTDAAAKKYYNANKSRFSTDQVHAMHILLKTEQEARAVLAKAKAPGADFQALAEKYSQDPSAKNNRGDLGFFSRDTMVEEFAEPAFRAGEGEIIGPIHTSFGYHIIKVIQKKIGKPMGYDEVELKVKNQLRQELVQSYVAKLRQGARIRIDEKALERM